jgi:hypothetical protein
MMVTIRIIAFTTKFTIWAGSGDTIDLPREGDIYYCCEGYVQIGPLKRLKYLVNVLGNDHGGREYG